MNAEVVIVGAGLAGLCCARRLTRQGVHCVLLEAADAVGGRVRTDLVEGFRLDRGFQVLLTSYPEARAVLDHKALRLRPFTSGALVRHAGKFHEVADPWRRPLAALRGLASPIGTWLDKWRVASFRARALRGSLDERLADPETTSLQALRAAGFSPAMIERFFRPFFGGVFLDPELRTSSRMLAFVFRMFARGAACLPAEGMEAIPRQLATGLPADAIRLRTPVAAVEAGAARLASGERLSARAVVVAVEAPVAAELLGGVESTVTEQADDGERSSATARSGKEITTACQGVTCLYFAAPRAPLTRPLLVLNGEGRGPINNLCVPTAAAPSYGPGGESLVSAAVLGADHDAEQLLQDARGQLADWFGAEVRGWRHLRTYVLPRALPSQFPPALDPPRRSPRWRPGVYVCGDHRDNASIDGAMVSGRRAAEAILRDWGVG